MNHDNDGQWELKQSSIFDFIEKSRKQKEEPARPNNILQFSSARKRVSGTDQNENSSLASAIRYSESLDW